MDTGQLPNPISNPSPCQSHDFPGLICTQIQWWVSTMSCLHPHAMNLASLPVSLSPPLCPSLHLGSPTPISLPELSPF